MIAKHLEAIANARTKVLELSDLLSQLQAPAPVTGLVVGHDQACFTHQDYRDAKAVRIVSGRFAGRIGTVERVDLDRKERGYMAEVKISGEGTVCRYLVERTLANPTVVVLGEPETLIENPEPREFRIGRQAIVNGDRWDVTSEPDGDGRVEMLDEDGEPGHLFVGRPDLVVPIGKSAGKVHLLVAGSITSAELPRSFEVKEGDRVELNEMGQVIRILTGMPNLFGAQVAYARKLENGMIEVDGEGGKRIVYDLTGAESLEQGDVLALDKDGAVALLKVPQPKREVAQRVDLGVRWEDIGGQEEAKEALREAVEYPIVHKDLFAYYGKKGPKGVALYGPPGTGKTMLAKAVARSLADRFGEAVMDTGFIYVKGPEILSQWVGVAEATVRGLFNAARKHKAEHGYPAVIFIDEAEAVFFKRGKMRSSDVNNTIVPQFLSEMDGLEESGAIVIMATNRPDSLDPAVTREGRIDRKVRVGRPDKETAAGIFEIYLRKVPSHREAHFLAQEAAEALFHGDLRLYTLETEGGERAFTLGHLASGAMIANIVDQATTAAMHRDLKSGEPPKGLQAQDLFGAVESAFRMNVDLNHEDDLRDFAESLGLRPTGVAKHRVA